MITVCYAGEQPPEEWDASVFLAGPTPRDPGVPSWRPEAIAELERQWHNGVLVVFVPEPADGKRYPDYEDQVDWEERWLDAADTIMFWIPRAMATMPGLTTNIEFGRYESSGRVVLGAPESAERMEYLRIHALRNGAPVTTTLANTVRMSLSPIGDGVPRSGGERFVPMKAWQSPTFRNWYAAQQNAGNTLLHGKLLWTRKAFLWVFHARMHIAAEDRVKSNEIVLGRPDVVSIVAYHPGETVLQHQVVLVREFRLPSCSPDGYVRELPGGGVLHGEPVDQAAHELAEETGLQVGADRLCAGQVRQAIATLSAHRVHVFTVELTADEIASARENPGPHGIAEDSERTFVEIRSYSDILGEQLVDWVTVGVLAAAFTGPAR